jgi:XTP/dITP diphosphohydrolase
MQEAGYLSDPDEDGSTFEENALIKAKTLAAAIPWFYGGPACGGDTSCALSKPKADRRFDVVLSDDSGLEIDALGGDPGVHSARFMGHDTPYEEKCAAILKKLDGLTGNERSARFVCVCAAAFPDGSAIITKGIMEGQIAAEYRGENGFGYDPVFWLPEYGKTAAELSEEEKNAVSHRGKALREMAKKLQERFAESK